MTVTELENLITGLVAAELAVFDLPDLHVDSAFTELGLDSTGLVAVAGAVEDELGLAVPPELLFDYPSISALAQYLAGSEQAPSHV